MKKIILSLIAATVCLVSFQNSALADAWHPKSALNVGKVVQLLKDPTVATTVYAVVELKSDAPLYRTDHSLYKSTNDGQTWNLVRNLPNSKIIGLLSYQGKLDIFTSNDTNMEEYSSVDHGLTWQKVASWGNGGMNSKNFIYQVTSNGLYVNFQHNLYYSKDGVAWKNITYRSQYTTGAGGFVVDDAHHMIYAIKEGQLGVTYSSTDKINWAPALPLPGGHAASSIVLHNNELFVNNTNESKVANGQVYTCDVTNPAKCDFKPAGAGIAVGNNVNKLTTYTSSVDHKNYLVAETNDGLFVYNDSLQKWQPMVTDKLTSNAISIFKQLGDQLYVGSTLHLYKAAQVSAMQLNLTESDQGINGLYPMFMAKLSSNYLVANFYGDFVFKSTDNGKTWSSDNAGLPFSGSSYDLNTRLYPGKFAVDNVHQKVLVNMAGRGVPLTKKGIYVRGFNDSQWQKEALPSIWSFYMTMHAGTLYSFGQTSTKALYYTSTDDGKTWAAVANSKANPVPDDKFIQKMLFYKNNIYLISLNQIYVFDTMAPAAGWHVMADPDNTLTNVSAVIMQGKLMLLGYHGSLFGNKTYSLYVADAINTSGNNGWKALMNNFYSVVTSDEFGLIDVKLSAAGPSIYLGAATDGVFESHDKGSTWVHESTDSMDFPYHRVTAVLATETAAGYPGEAYVGTPYGIYSNVAS